MSEKTLFRSIQTYPDSVSATSSLVRLVDGIGFRFYWATDSLRDEDFKFRGSDDSMSIGELIEHVWGLAYWMNENTSSASTNKKDDEALFRSDVLEQLGYLREALSAMSDEELQAVEMGGVPFWHLINGPMADALTHIGQINLLRRMAGNPTAKCNVFLGEAPT